MSIILDALKKAEQGQSPSAENAPAARGQAAGTFKPQGLKGVTHASSSNTVKIIFVFVAIGFLFGIVWFQFGDLIQAKYFGKKSQVFEPISSSAPVKNQKAPGTVAEPAPSSSVQTDATQTKIKELQELAGTKFSEGQFVEAAKAYEKLAQLLPADATLYNNQGVALKKAGQIGEAKQAYQTALALDANYAEAYNNLAVAEMSEGKYNEARNNLTRALEINPDYTDALLHMALCLEKLGATSEAVKNYERFLSISQGQVDRKTRLQVEDRLANLKERM